MHIHTPSYMVQIFQNCMIFIDVYMPHIAMASNTSLFPSFFPAPVVVDGNLTKPKISKGKKTKKTEPRDLNENTPNDPLNVL